MRRPNRLIAAALFWLAASAGAQADVHAMWVWRPAKIVASAASVDGFISEILMIRARAVYLYLDAADYADPRLAAAVRRMNRAGLRVWGLNGSRDSFADAAGPATLFAAADALAGFNRGHRGQAAFSGFVADLEPQDGQETSAPAAFHNGLADSRLTPAQSADRLALMADWVALHQRLRRIMRRAGLPNAGAFPAWTLDYQGELVHVGMSGQRQGVTAALMKAVSVYIVMSYRTDPVRAIALLRGPLRAAAALASAAPVVVGALEIHAGGGPAVSYSDDPAKRAKSAVLEDVRTITLGVSPEPGFGGIDIHDWAGWHTLPR
jgi:hypothetical protein